MNLHFTEEQRMIQKLVRDFAQKEIKPRIQEIERGQFPREVFKKMGDLGLMGIPIPKEYGGAGKDFTSYIIAIHELSKVNASIGVVLSVHTSVGTNPILYFGSPEQKEKYIPKLASGEYIGAFCLTEPSAGSDAGSLKTRAEVSGEHYILNGSKVFITNGDVADIYIVFASTHPEKGTDGISAFVVEKSTSGLLIGKEEQKMGLKGCSTTSITFENMKLPKENLLGEEGQGFKIAMSNLDGGRIGIAAQALGIAEAAFEEILGHASKYGVTSQGISFKLADMATMIEASKLLVYQGASLRSAGQACSKEASIAKLFSSSSAVSVTSEGIQILGVEGYTEDTPLERYFRDAKVTEIYEGTSEIQRIVISKRL